MVRQRIGAIAALVMLIGSSGCRGGNGTQIPLEKGVAGLRQWQEWLSVPPVSTQPVALLPVKTSAQLQTALEEHVRTWNLPGAVLYVASSDGDWMRAVGRADLDAKTLLKPTDRFRTGDVSELFMGVVCLRLIDAGVLTLNAPIANWLPADLTERLPHGDQITLQQLLNHTSGLPAIDADAFQQAVLVNPSHRWSPQEVVSFVLDRPAAVPRGTFRHSRANYLLLQLIVERATDQPFAEVLQQQILQPLQLKDTFLELSQPDEAGQFVQGYQDWNRDNSPENVTQPLINTGLGLGDQGVISSAPDLVRLMRALFLEDTLLSATSRKQLLTLVENNEGGYGLGIAHTLTKWGEVWGQAGETTGFRSVVAYLPVHDLILVSWTNSGDRNFGHPTRLAEKSLEIILGDTYLFTRRAIR